MILRTNVAGTLLAFVVLWAGNSGAQTVEAERGTLLGNASVYADPAASGGQGVAYIDSPGSGFRLDNAPAASGVSLRYASERSGGLSVFVDGSFAGDVDFESTGSWVENYEFVFLPVDIPAGGEFEILFRSGDTAMNVDLLDFVAAPPSQPQPNPEPTAEAVPAAFGIDPDGNLFHVDEGWSASFHYLCVDGTCFPGTRTDGVFRRDVATEVAVGQTVHIEFKVEEDGGQCLTGEVVVTRQPGLTAARSPCGSTTNTAASQVEGVAGHPPTPVAPPAVPAPPDETNAPPPPRASPGPESTDTPSVAWISEDGEETGRAAERGAGRISVAGDTITTRLAERFRDRHESDRNHDTYIREYAQGSTYEIVLVDRPDALEVQIHSPRAPLSMVNLRYDHIPDPGFVDPPRYRGGGFMSKGSLEGPADDNAGLLVDRLYFELRDIGGRPWSEVRDDRDIVTLEFTPRRELDGNLVQYYSDILRYRAGRGGITFERDDPRYFSAGPTTQFAHGSPGLEFSQPYLGIDEPSLHAFTLGRELFRASFLGDPLPGNGGAATGADPGAAASACLDCHFRLGKAAPPGRGRAHQQGIIHNGGDLRVAPPLIGLGLLEAVDPDTIAQRARETGGRVPDGRFGWKAGAPTIRDQIVKAFRDDLGVENVDPTFIDRVEDYVRGLGVPLRRHPAAQMQQQPNVALRFPDARSITDADVLDGEAAFRESGCVTCHLPSLQTGGDHPVPQFRNITIRPFTDLLLWDMGPDLCADSDEGRANRCEWRTAPLWGIRLQQRVTGHATFLHDGRATTLDAAIRWHGGDARASREAYTNLLTERRMNLLLYLQSL